MGDPLRPLNKREELFVSCLADVGHEVIHLAAGMRLSYRRFGKHTGNPQS